MIEMKNEELINIVGGINISGILLTGVYRSIGSIVDIGRSFGTSLRMIKANKFCSI